MKKRKIDKDEYLQWRDGSITAVVFKALQRMRDRINEDLTNSHLIFKEDGGKTLARLVGQRESIDLILNIEYDDVEPDQETQNEE